MSDSRPIFEKKEMALSASPYVYLPAEIPLYVVEVVHEDEVDAVRHPFHIYLGATKAAAAAGLPVGKLADEEHVVKTVGSGLYLLGGDGDTTYDEAVDWKCVAMRGTLYAAYDFLENEMDVRWLWPGETGEVVPKRAALVVGALDRRAQEPLSVRFYYGGGYKVKIRVYGSKSSSCASGTASAARSGRDTVSRNGGSCTTRSIRNTSTCCRTASACRIVRRRFARCAFPSRASGSSASRNGADGGRMCPGSATRPVRG